jgi:hypothetical protein
MPTLPLATFFSGMDFLIIMLIVMVLFGAGGITLVLARAADRRMSGSHADRLKKLETLKQQGLMTELEYQTQRKRILNEV